MIDFYARPADISTSLYWSECPSVKPEHISLAQRSHPQNQNLVMFRGKMCWFKAVHDAVPDKVFAREIDTLLRARKIGLSNQIRAPKLNGLVMSPKAGHIHGLLLDAVNNHGSVWDRCKDPIALRKRWYNDVARMLAQLHEADIVWGDFKPANMLVDEKDDVWLIDFGGGMTEGWLDGENIETKKGDLQGLAEFENFFRLKNVKRKDRLCSKTRKQSPDQARHQNPDPRRQQRPDKARKQSPDQKRAHSAEKTIK
jgi:serine/threonine-protein kinase RIO1